MAKQAYIGKVVSTKMPKSVVVLTTFFKKHPLYGKTVRKSRRFKAHVPEDLTLKEGDLVKIESCRPISKEKSFVVKEKL